MLHNEARRLLVQAYEQTHDAQTVAECFQVSTSTVYRLSGQKKKTGSVELQTSQRGRKPALTEEDLQGIDQLIAAQPDITIGERSADKTPLNTPANTTILSSIRRNGETAYTIYSGGTTREKFLDYLKNTLIPTLHEGELLSWIICVRIMAKRSGRFWRGPGMKLRYLPAYSPDLNPIENALHVLPWSDPGIQLGEA